MGDDRGRAVGVGDEVQHSQQQHGGWLGETQDLRCLRHDCAGVAQVGADVAAPAGRDGCEQGAGAHQHQRVVVGVGDPAGSLDVLGDLVGGSRSRQARADVEELADTAVSGQVVHRPAQERPVRSRPRHHLGAAADDVLGGPAVGREGVLAAQPVAVDAGRVSGSRVEPAGTGRAGGVLVGGSVGDAICLA
jgi:hypothetical protein